MQCGGRGRGGGPRFNQDSLLGAIPCDPDDWGVATACPRASHGHCCIRAKSEQRRQQEVDRPLVHLIFSLPLPHGHGSVRSAQYGYASVRSRVRRVAFLSKRAVNDPCLGENCPAAALRYGWNSCDQ